jgi:hypothetical protein
MQPEDLDHVEPRSRLLLAVPFVGKDVPSRASEFSHPDVVIGLSTLAYRYEGSHLNRIFSLQAFNLFIHFHSIQMLIRSINPYLSKSIVDTQTRMHDVFPQLR